MHFTSIAARAQLTLWFNCIKRPKKDFDFLLMTSNYRFGNFLEFEKKKKKIFEAMCIVFQFLVNMRNPEVKRLVIFGILEPLKF